MHEIDQSLELSANRAVDPRAALPSHTGHSANGSRATLFEYRARRSDGVTVDGRERANDLAALDRSLEKEGLTLVKAKAVSSRSRSRRARMGRADLIAFSTQLATMLHAGVPLVTALRQVAQRAPRASTRTVVQGIVQDLEAGDSFADALDAQSESFAEIYRASVRAGEQSTSLPEVLRRQAKYLQWVREIRATTLQALVYPAMLAAAVVFLIGVLLTFMLPRLVKLYPGGHDDLPAQTRRVMAVSDFMLGHWMPLLGVLALTGFGTWSALRSTRVRERFSGAMLRVPRLGPLIRMLATSRFATTAATLHDAGCDVVATLGMAAKACGHPALEAAFNRVLQRVERGSTIAAALEREPQMDSFLVQLAAVGETSGDLGGSFRNLAVCYDEEVPRTVKWALSLIEPAVIVVGGAAVLYILLAAMLPIVTLYEKIA